ncbi:MAG: DUF2796 domain-containing protein [Pseudomonadota bacterium]|nr:DUF2796 domain-containing protein [Pseudomonadota bacterium]
MNASIKPMLLLLSLLTVTVHADEPAEQVQHGAHVHGEATLQLVLQGNDLEMELHSPAMNIIGFEHQAVSAKDQQKLQQAIAALEAANELFRFQGTSCESVKAAVNLSHDTSAHEHEHEHEETTDHHNEQHKHQEEGHTREPVQHSEFIARYVFRCDNGSRLRQINVALLQQFSGIHRLDAQWIFNARQGAAELSADSPTIEVP